MLNLDHFKISRFSHFRQSRACAFLLISTTVVISLTEFSELRLIEAATTPSDYPRPDTLFDTTLSFSFIPALSVSLLSARGVFQQFADWILSLEGAISIIGKCAFIAAIGFATEAGENFWYGDLRRSVNPPSTNLPESDIPARRSPLSSYSSISSRNIFAAVSKDEPEEKKAPEPVTNLQLRLVGTNVGSNSSPFAIIENTSKREQDVFDLKESVFGQAKLVEVLQESVKLDRNGKIEILVLQESDQKSSSSGSGIESLNEDQTDFSVAESELEDALANLPRLLSQARAVPYFRNGKSVGMRLFAIRRGSLYEKLGLKNGDIIKEVNENSLTDPAQALKLFEQLKSERSIQVKVERSGQDTQLRYAID